MGGRKGGKNGPGGATDGSFLVCTSDQSQDGVFFSVSDGSPGATETLRCAQPRDPLDRRTAQGSAAWALQPDHLDPEASSLTDRPCVTTGIPAPYFLRVMGVVRAHRVMG